MTDATTYTVRVGQDKARLRLDRFLADALPDLSRSRLKALIEAGCVARHGAGAVTDPAAKVRAGESYDVAVPAAAPARPAAQAIRLDVVYEDADLIVVDKPAGLVVHPAPGNPDRTLVNALLAHAGESLSGIGGVARPGIVHRLDKGTSGLMVVAKNDAAHRALAAQIEARTLERRYKALVWGRPDPAKGTIETAIGRNPKNRKKMAVVNRGGRRATTHYTTERALGTRAALVQCRLETGRTHQIRVHMAYVGCPVVGDPVYGGGRRRWTRDAPETTKRTLAALDHQALHAYMLAFDHPRTGRRVEFESRLPIYFRELISLLELL